jgi:hypothetical protein
MLIKRLVAIVIGQLALKGSMANTDKTLYTHHETTTQAPINAELTPTGNNSKSLDIPKTKAVAVDV